MQYVAFLRGINVGGNSLVKMSELKQEFEKAGMTDVETILASGNVIFSSEDNSYEMITEKLEKVIKKKWKKDITVFVRTMAELKAMSALQPFKGVTVHPNTRLYVTFLYENSRGLKIPELPINVKLTRIKDDAVFTAVELSEEENSPDALAPLHKVLGPNITVRNWNTVQKILAAAS